MRYLPLSIGSAFRDSYTNASELLESGFQLVRKSEKPGADISFILDPQFMSEKDLQLFIGLYQTLNIPDDYFCSNCGDTTFDGSGNHKWLNVPTIGLSQNRMTLRIGVADGDEPALEVPIIWEDGQYWFKFKDMPAVKAELDHVKSDYDNELKFYIVAVAQDESVGYFLPFRCEDGVDSTQIVAAWKNGNMEEIVSPFFGDALSFSNSFGYAFMNETFPKEGVMLLLSKGKINPGDFSGKEILSSVWNIADCSHPELLVGIYRKAEGLKKVLKLGDATSIYMGASSQATKLLLKKISEGTPRFDIAGKERIIASYVMVYVEKPFINRATKKSPATVDYGKQPSHQAMFNPAILPMLNPQLAALFPEFVKKSGETILKAKMASDKRVKESGSTATTFGRFPANRITEQQKRHATQLYNAEKGVTNQASADEVIDKHFDDEEQREIAEDFLGGELDGVEVESWDETDALNEEF